MVPIYPLGCDHITMVGVDVTCAMLGEGVDGGGGLFNLTIIIRIMIVQIET